MDKWFKLISFKITSSGFLDSLVYGTLNKVGIGLPYKERKRKQWKKMHY